MRIIIITLTTTITTTMWMRSKKQQTKRVLVRIMLSSREVSFQFLDWIGLLLELPVKLVFLLFIINSRINFYTRHEPTVEAKSYHRLLCYQQCCVLCALEQSALRSHGCSSAVRLLVFMC